MRLALVIVAVFCLSSFVLCAPKPAETDPLENLEDDEEEEEEDHHSSSSSSQHEREHETADHDLSQSPFEGGPEHRSSSDSEDHHNSSSSSSSSMGDHHMMSNEDHHMMSNDNNNDHHSGSSGNNDNHPHDVSDFVNPPPDHNSRGGVPDNSAFSTSHNNNHNDHNDHNDNNGPPPPHHSFGLGQAAGDSFECREDEHCPTYSYCFEGFCHTKFIHANGGLSCFKLDASGHKVANHEKCRLTDAEGSGVPVVFSTARCFKELNYNCARAYFMPCTPNYDENDEVVKGQEEACPTHFNCTLKKYGPDHDSRSVKLCVPDKYKHEQNPTPDEICATNFDCGYEVKDADLDDGWGKCQSHSCMDHQMDHGHGGGGLDHMEQHGGGDKGHDQVPDHHLDQLDEERERHMEQQHQEQQEKEKEQHHDSSTKTF